MVARLVAIEGERRVFLYETKSKGFCAPSLRCMRSHVGLRVIAGRYAGYGVMQPEGFLRPEQDDAFVNKR